MTTSGVGARATEALAQALRAAGTSPALEDLRQVLAYAHGQLDQPMRVAIVGQIKAGKSTMLNALLGEELVATGVEELTYNVNWLRFAADAADAGLVVHFKDGRPPERRTLAELEEVSSRRDEARELLSAIRHVEVRVENPLLQRFNLIDTPGLESHFVQDSENTLDFLGLSMDDVEASTRRASADADALLCLFSRSLATSDESIVSRFQGPLLGQATPINAIGVLSQVEGYWSHEDPDRDPLIDGKRVASRIFGEPEADRIFFAVLPVCSKVGLGAQTITDAEWSSLFRLATEVDPDRLRRALTTATRFSTKVYDDVPVSPAEREAVLRRLERWGTWLGASLIRDGLHDREAVCAELLRRSELPLLRDLLLSHFGNRSQLIKLATALRRVRPIVLRDRQRLDGPERDAVLHAERLLEQLELREHAFRELALLRAHYADPRATKLSDEEIAQLLDVTGERGPSCAARLGLGEGATTGEMLDVAEERVRRWRRRARRPGTDSRTKATAEAVATCFERIRYHVGEADRHLRLEV